MFFPLLSLNYFFLLIRIIITSISVIIDIVPITAIAITKKIKTIRISFIILILFLYVIFLL